jgi:hypothetical protein
MLLNIMDKVGFADREEPFSTYRDELITHIKERYGSLPKALELAR